MGESGARETARKKLISQPCNYITGGNGRTAQYYCYDDDGFRIYGLYDENGDFAAETKDIEEALDYIGL